MKKDSLAATSLLCSVLLHVVFIGSSYYLAVPSGRYPQTPLEKMFNVKTISRDVGSTEKRRPEPAYIEHIKFEKQDEITRKILTPLLETKKNLLMPDTFEPSSEKKLLDATNKDSQPDVDLDLLKEKIEIVKRRVVNKDATNELDLSAAWQSLLFGEKTEVEASTAFTYEMTAFTPDLARRLARLTQSFDRPSEVTDFGTPAGLMTGRNVESIDEFLSVTVETYQESQDEEGYYRISISPGRDVEKFKVLSKEIIFLVDASLSIQTKRLRAFKKGIESVLGNLNEGDRFNIITFKQEINVLSQAALRVNPLNISLALDFLDGLRASQRTDLYKTFLEALELKASLHPSYIILLSDGRPNSGIVSPLEIIAEITAVNDRRRSIFTYSGGPKVNRYLLDFLAYQNRGWSEYAKDARHLSSGLGALYEKIRNPLLTDVRFQVGGLDLAQVYPKHLPDFYRDTHFVIYGRYAKPIPFSFRVVGFVDGNTKELVSRHDLSQVSRGGAEIAREWAYNKVYHLMGQMALEGQDFSRLQEIYEIRKKFNL